MGVLHRHRHPGLWTPKRVPLETVEVDRGHPLAQNLLAAYVPGSPSFLNDLAGYGPTLIPGSGLAMATTQEGRGCFHGATGSAAAALLPSAMKVTDSISVYWRGFSVGNHFGNTPIWFGAQYTNTDTSPFFGACISGTEGAASIGWGTNDGTAADTGNPGTLAVGSMNSFGVTFSYPTASGNDNIIFYQGGVGFAPSVFGITGPAPAYSANSQLVLGGYVSDTARYPNAVSTAAYMWSRVLSAAEMAWLDAEPFAMLRPVVRRLFAGGGVPQVPYQRWPSLGPMVAQ